MLVKVVTRSVRMIIPDVLTSDPDFTLQSQQFNLLMKMGNRQTILTGLVVTNTINIVRTLSTHLRGSGASR